MSREWQFLSALGIGFVLILYWVAPVDEWAVVTGLWETVLILYGADIWRRQYRELRDTIEHLRARQGQPPDWIPPALNCVIRDRSAD